jgi:hypothetical protein
MTGLLLIYVSRLVISATEPLRISSWDNTLNWMPMIFDVFFSVELVAVDIIPYTKEIIFRLLFQFLLNF